jgi:hypothetical protein
MHIIASNQAIHKQSQFDNTIHLHVVVIVQVVVVQVVVVQVVVVQVVVVQVVVVQVIVVIVVTYRLQPTRTRNRSKSKRSTSLSTMTRCSISAHVELIIRCLATYTVLSTGPWHWQ